MEKDIPGFLIRHKVILFIDWLGIIMLIDSVFP